MPWLAELVESSESSLDVLPVQCLCEFLLHDVPAEGSSSALEDDDESKAERYKRKQVRRLYADACNVVFVKLLE